MTKYMKHRISLWNSAVGSLVVGLSLSIPPVFAATLTVTNTYDSGLGSLRDAITSASPGDTINFSLGYPTTITLGSTLVVDKNLMINGPGASNLAISGNKSVGVFVIEEGVTARISGVTIENGSAYSYSNAGGGIYNSGTLTVANSTLSGNSAAAAGGGIYNYAGSTLMVTNSTLSGNSAPGGGGIFVLTSTLTVTNSMFSGNSAGYGGGAISTDSVVSTVTATVDGSTFAGNSAGSYGGGIFNSGTRLTVTNSTFSGNSAPIAGGILNNGIAGTTLALNNSTLSGNSADFGGGIFNFGFGTVTFNNSTLSGNSAPSGGGIFIQPMGALTAKNTIMANHPGGNCATFSPGPLFSSEGHNLSDDGTCSSFLTQTGDLNNTPAGLDPSGLQNNGGPTKTIALLPTGPAVNAIPVSPVNYCTAVDGVTPIASDQRGVPRPQGSACDIGAFEYSAGYNICLLYEPTHAVNSGSAIPIKIQLCDSNRTDLSSSSIVVHAVQVQQVSTSITGPVQTSGNANPDNDFRYDPSLGPTGGYILNLSTNGLPSGAYNLQFTATGDPVTHSVGFGVK